MTTGLLLLSSRTAALVAGVIGLAAAVVSAVLIWPPYIGIACKALAWLCLIGAATLLTLRHPARAG
jgi:hypothetical protein